MGLQNHCSLQQTLRNSQKFTYNIIDNKCIYTKKFYKAVKMNDQRKLLRSMWMNIIKTMLRKKQYVQHGSIYIRFITGKTIIYIYVYLYNIRNIHTSVYRYLDSEIYT